MENVSKHFIIGSYSAECSYRTLADIPPITIQRMEKGANKSNTFLGGRLGLSLFFKI